MFSESLAAVLKDGALVASGMPRFAELRPDGSALQACFRREARRALAADRVQRRCEAPCSDAGGRSADFCRPDDALWASTLYGGGTTVALPGPQAESCDVSNWMTIGALGNVIS